VSDVVMDSDVVTVLLRVGDEEDVPLIVGNWEGVLDSDCTTVVVTVEEAVWLEDNDWAFDRDITLLDVDDKVPEIERIPVTVPFTRAEPLCLLEEVDETDCVIDADEHADIDGECVLEGETDTDFELITLAEEEWVAEPDTESETVEELVCSIELLCNIAVDEALIPEAVDTSLFDANGLFDKEPDIVSDPVILGETEENREDVDCSEGLGVVLWLLRLERDPAIANVREDTLDIDGIGETESAVDAEFVIEEVTDTEGDFETLVDFDADGE
jgi:hypothetical protein